MMSGYQSSSDGVESDMVRSTIHSVQNVKNTGAAQSDGVSLPQSVVGFAPLSSARPPVSGVGADQASLPLVQEAGGEEGELAVEPLDSTVEPCLSTDLMSEDSPTRRSHIILWW